MTKITTTAFIFHNNKLLLVFHKKLQKWMHVGGHLEKNEFFDETLRREIWEEVGLNIEIMDINPISIKPLSKKLVPQHIPWLIHGVDGKSDKKLCLDYICRAKEPVNVVIQKEELDDFRWVDRNQIHDYDCPSGLITIALKAFDVLEELSIQEDK